MTYFRMGNPHYHWRGVVSLSCSGWEGVGPTRYGRQTKLYQRTEDREPRTECRRARRDFISVLCILSSVIRLEEVKVFDCCEKWMNRVRI